MYNCQVCGKTVGPGVRAFLIVAKRQRWSHPYRPKVNRIKIEDKWELTDDPGGEGYQIKKELRACPDCRHYSPELSENPSAFEASLKPSVTLKM